MLEVLDAPVTTHVATSRGVSCEGFLLAPVTTHAAFHEGEVLEGLDAPLTTHVAVAATVFRFFTYAISDVPLSTGTPVQCNN